MDKVFENLISELINIEEIMAITLGGSRSTGYSDEKSDYDVYIYTSEKINRDVRENILKKYCSYMEINNSYWELEDNCTLNNGIDIDIIYRDFKEFKGTIDYVIGDLNNYNGYTTCMWHNLLTSKILYDKNGEYQNFKNKYNIKYPKVLKEKIIKNNFNLLTGTMPAYDAQIKKAYERGDLVSINHRISEFLASYFDIIFAINEISHPGEKREVEIATKKCNILPKNFKENIELLLTSMYKGNIVNETVQSIISELKEIL